jgi:hypothetical protein
VRTDSALEQRIRTLYAVSVPTELDRRISTAVTMTPSTRLGFRRPLAMAALAMAAVLIAAAGPAIGLFESWSRPFDQLWSVATPVDRSVTVDGYEVTAHRAYADRLGVRVALTVKDLEGRWTGLEVEQAVAVDAQGRAFPAWNWSGSRTPVDGTVATWARFELPDGFQGDVGSLRVTVTSLHVRTSQPVVGLDPEQIWTSVGGAWTLEVDVPPITEGTSVAPVATANTAGVSIAMEELAVVPSGTVVRLAIDGLPGATAGDVYGWLPDVAIIHDGEPFDGDQPFEPGIVSGEGIVTIEAVPNVDDLAGHWRITVHSFYAFDGELEQGHTIEGPWVLEFDVPEQP